uniref:Large ribosomal subunit protein bL21m n=1 Tax=Neolamprologus brichardi TaxID=32507 RepID=A0A3Q4MA38_NEOBR
MVSTDRLAAGSLELAAVSCFAPSCLLSSCQCQRSPAACKLCPQEVFEINSALNKVLGAPENHFLSWKVTGEDLILIENHIEAECGERIRMEKVLLVGAEDFTLIGRPLLGKELVRVEATVIEKTESWPKVHMRFWKRHRFQRKKIIIQPQTVLRINGIELTGGHKCRCPQAL